MRFRRSIAAGMPWGLLGTLGLVLAVESHLRHRDADFTPMEVWSWRLSGRAATRPDATASPILCFGDSTMKLGLAPHVIAEHTGLPAFNLAVLAANPPAPYFLLRRTLAAGARPAAVFLSFEPNLLAHDRWFAARYWTELATTRDLLDLAVTSRDATFLGWQVLARALVSFRQRQEIRSAIRDRLIGRGDSPRHQARPSIRNWLANRGGMLFPPSPDSQREVDFDYPQVILDKILPRQWACESTNAIYIGRFLALAQSRGIPVFLVLTPFRPKVQALRELTGLDARFSDFAARLLAGFPELTVVDARRAGYEHRLFVDQLHLDARGTARMTADVIGAVAPRLAGRDPHGGWITLAPGPPQPTAVALEDLEASRAFLRVQRQASRRR